MIDILKKWAPLTFEAFEEYRLGAVQLSATGVKLVQKRLTGGKPIIFEESGLSKREWVELCAIFDVSQ